MCIRQNLQSSSDMIVNKFGFISQGVHGILLRSYLVQGCLLHQLKGGGVNLAVFKVHQLIKLLFLPLCYLRSSGWRSGIYHLGLIKALFNRFCFRSLTSAGVMQSSTSGESWQENIEWVNCFYKCQSDSKLRKHHFKSITYKVQSDQANIYKMFGVWKKGSLSWCWKNKLTSHTPSFCSTALTPWFVQQIFWSSTHYHYVTRQRLLSNSL